MTLQGYDQWKCYTPDQYAEDDDARVMYAAPGSEPEPEAACYGCGDPIPEGEGYLTDCETDDGEPTRELCCWACAGRVA